MLPSGPGVERPPAKKLVMCGSRSNISPTSREARKQLMQGRVVIAPERTIDEGKRVQAQARRRRSARSTRWRSAAGIGRRRGTRCSCRATHLRTSHAVRRRARPASEEIRVSASEVIRRPADGWQPCRETSRVWAHRLHPGMQRADMIGHGIEHELHAAGMQVRGEHLQVCERAEVLIDSERRPWRCNRGMRSPGGSGTRA